MLDLRYDSIVYQSQVYVSALVDELITNKKLGKALESKWAKVDLILAYLEALENKDNLQDATDITDITYILECLIILCEIASFPTAPTLLWSGTPSILVGIPGPAGAAGTTGSTGQTGLATDFQISNVSVTSIVDSFPVGDARAARWDYFVSNGTAQRASSILGHWLSDGSLDELTDDGAEDLGGDTAGIEFDIVYSGGNIQLIATITSGTWTIVGSRYFIPNNGNGSGPVSSVLPYSKVFIGNILDIATAQTVSGAITITNTGVTTLGAGVVGNTNIAAAAAIAFSKMAALTSSELVVTDGSGFITTLSAPSLTEVGYITGLTSSAQTQINTKLADPMTTIGDIIIRNASNVTVRLAAGTVNQVLTIVGGVPTWAAAPGGISGLTTGVIPKASSATTLANSIISESGGSITIAGTTSLQSGFRTAASGVFLKVITIDIGDWNMDTGPGSTITHGLPDHTKIRSINVTVRNDANTQVYDLCGRANSLNTSGVSGYIGSIGSVFITLSRVDAANGGNFDSTNFDSTSYNRGWVTIIYEA